MKNKINFIRQAMKEQGVGSENDVTPPLLQEPEADNHFLPPNSSKEELKDAIVQRVMEKIQEQQQMAPQEGEAPQQEGNPPSAEGDAPAAPATEEAPAEGDAPPQSDNEQGNDELLFDDEDNIAEPIEDSDGESTDIIHNDEENIAEPEGEDTDSDFVNADNLVVGSARRIVADNGMSLDTIVDENNLEHVLDSLSSTFEDAEDDSNADSEDDSEEEEEKPKGKAKGKKKDPKNHVLDVVHNLLETVKSLVENHSVKKASLNSISDNDIHIACRYMKAMEFPTKDALKTYLDEHPDADKSEHWVKNDSEKEKQTEEKKETPKSEGAPIDKTPEDKPLVAPKKKNYSKKEVNDAVDAFNALPHDDPDAERIKNNMSKSRDFSPENLRREIVEWHQNKNKKPEAPKSEEPKKSETPKEAPKTEEKKPETPKPEAPEKSTSLDEAYSALSALPKSEREKIENDLLQNSGTTEELDKKVQDWHSNSKKPAKTDTSNSKDMESKGYAKKKVDNLHDDLVFTDVSSGKKIKFSELPKAVQDKLIEKNKSEGLWHTPATKPEVPKAEEPKKPETPKEAPKSEEPKKTEAPKKEEPKQENKKSESKNEETKDEPVDPPELTRYSEDEVKQLTDKHKPFELKDALKGLKDKVFKKNDPPKDLKVWLSKKPTVKEFVDNLMKWHKGGKKDKAASEVVIANHIVNEFISERIAADFIKAVKDKDLMRDTGGKSKSNTREPHFKPSRTDLKNRYKDKKLTKDEKDVDIHNDKDLI